MSVLELNHVKKSFNNGELQVLQDISLSVEKGEVVAIIGPSGSGKSTLLRCATLLERIDSGEVCFDGHYAARTGDDGTAVYADKAELKQIRNYFGLVFQQFNLFPHYSVLKNVMDAPICVQKRDRSEVEASARRTLEKMGLGDKADAGLKADLEGKITSLRKLMEGDDAAAIKAATEELAKASHKLAEQLYSQAQGQQPGADAAGAAGAQPGAGAAGGKKADDDVIDADFTESK